jgi:hypothetical protein
MERIPASERDTREVEGADGGREHDTGFDIGACAPGGAADHRGIAGGRGGRGAGAGTVTASPTRLSSKNRT